MLNKHAQTYLICSEKEVLMVLKYLLATVQSPSALASALVDEHIIQHI